MSLEPAKAYWAVAIAGSLALHAGALGVAAILIGSSYEQKTVVTEITFSAPPPSGCRACGKHGGENHRPEAGYCAGRPRPPMEYQVLQPAKAGGRRLVGIDQGCACKRR